MLQELELVLGAAATTDVHPALPNFYFHDARVQASNGHVTIDAALETGLDGHMVPAVRFVKAVRDCEGSPNLKKVDAKLVVSRGKFRARIPLLGGSDFPSVAAPQGDVVGRLSVAPLKALRPFVATDASRPFACGQMLSDGYVYATNNVVLARMPCEYRGPQVVIPVRCLDELLRLPFEEYDVIHSPSGLYFRPPNFDAWIHTRALDLPWPDMAKFFEWDAAQLPAIDGAQLLADVLRLKKHVPDDKVPVICFTADGMRTLDGDAGDAAIGEDSPVLSSWRAEMLELILSVATHADFGQYPKPCPWSCYPHKIDGMVVGFRT